MVAATIESGQHCMEELIAENAQYSIGNDGRCVTPPSTASNGNPRSTHDNSKKPTSLAPWRAIDDFFRAPAGKPFLAGAWLRIGFAVLFLYDRFVMWHNLGFFYSPVEGVLTSSAYSQHLHQPLHQTSLWDKDDEEYENDYGYGDSPFELFRYSTPETDPLFVKILFLMGVVHATCLLLGVCWPRLQAFGILVNIIAFQNREINMTHDMQDVLLILVSFYVLFLPLHKYTMWNLRDWWYSSENSEQGDRQTNKTESSSMSSWPMWPFRLLQIQTCCVYTGAGLMKLFDTEEQWVPESSFSAMHYMVHQHDFFGGVFRPNLLFGYQGPLQAATCFSLLLECTCWFLVWIPKLRPLVTFSMILFHLGIELGMNIHIFQWLSILCWSSFLVWPVVNEATVCGYNDNENDNVGKSGQPATDCATESSSSRVQSETASNSDKYNGNQRKSNILCKRRRSFMSLLQILVHTIFPLAIASSVIVLTVPTSAIHDTILLLDIFEDEDTAQDWYEYLVLKPVKRLRNSTFVGLPWFWSFLGIEQGVWSMYGAAGTCNFRLVARVALTINDTNMEDDKDSDDHFVYFTSPQWTGQDFSSSTWKRKKIFRQILFWNAAHYEPTVQHDISKRWGRQAILQRRRNRILDHGGTGDDSVDVDDDDWEREIDHVVLKQLAVDSPPPPDDWKGFWHPVPNPAKFLDYEETALYVYIPGHSSSSSISSISSSNATSQSANGGASTTVDWNTILGNGKDEDLIDEYNYEHGWEFDDETDKGGVWWDDRFYRYSRTRKEYSPGNFEDEGEDEVIELDDSDDDDSDDDDGDDDDGDDDDSDDDDDDDDDREQDTWDELELELELEDHGEQDEDDNDETDNEDQYNNQHTSGDGNDDDDYGEEL
eukprot:CAMPEP_0172363780 /NCGR_PEP_ID=MMETSP1060-20121228/7045_1 /TAXON_ID=37318 /ORGANISM="Pseudo-nitzschia pungens, Strain cf. cingulata" /LENGTH=882 /DNA_ID=CAMNT_0013086601 /DNA_START=147 /DNA_END=2795 /DNA_ORIENTATION=-